jgi:hypothetical protein
MPDNGRVHRPDPLAYEKTGLGRPDLACRLHRQQGECHRDSPCSIGPSRGFAERCAPRGDSCRCRLAGPAWLLARPDRRRRLDLPWQGRRRHLRGLPLTTIPTSKRASLGLEESHGGVLVADVVPGSDAARRGVANGDIILRVDRMNRLRPTTYGKRSMLIVPRGASSR